MDWLIKVDIDIDSSTRLIDLGKPQMDINYSNRYQIRFTTIFPTNNLEFNIDAKGIWGKKNNYSDFILRLSPRVGYGASYK